MRRHLMLAALALAVAGCCAPSAGAESLYRGRGPGIRVEFRVRHGEVYFARVRTVLKCVNNDAGRGKRFRQRLGTNLGSAPIRGNRFRNEFETEDAEFTDAWRLEGGVHPREITGRFWYQAVTHYSRHWRTCQTKHYRSMPIRYFGRDSLRFWASRRPVHSRVRR